MDFMIDNRVFAWFAVCVLAKPRFLLVSKTGFVGFSLGLQ